MTLPSDGKPIDVERLYFLELEDKVIWTDPGPYVHTYLDGQGRSWKEDYGLEDYEVIPEEPRVPAHEIEPGTEDYHKLETWRLYRAILSHERIRAQAMEDYLKGIALYILSNKVKPEDRERIKTPEDYAYVYKKALFPELTKEDIEAELASTFQGFMERASSIRGS